MPDIKQRTAQHGRRRAERNSLESLFRTRDYCRALEWFLQKRVIDVTVVMTGSRATFATTEASAPCAEQSHRRQDCGKCPNSGAARRGEGRAQTGAAPKPPQRGRKVLGRHSRQSRTAQGTAAERAAALGRESELRADEDSARGPGDCLRQTPSALRDASSLPCATGEPRQVLLQSLGGAA